jgi:hypothetical protein
MANSMVEMECPSSVYLLPGAPTQAPTTGNEAPTRVKSRDKSRNADRVANPLNTDTIFKYVKKKRNPILN